MEGKRKYNFLILAKKHPYSLLGCFYIYNICKPDKVCIATFILNSELFSYMIHVPDFPCNLTNKPIVVQIETKV